MVDLGCVIIFRVFKQFSTKNGHIICWYYPLTNPRPPPPPGVGIRLTHLANFSEILLLRKIRIQMKRKLWVHTIHTHPLFVSLTESQWNRYILHATWSQLRYIPDPMSSSLTFNLHNNHSPTLQRFHRLVDPGSVPILTRSAHCEHKVGNKGINANFVFHIVAVSFFVCFLRCEVRHQLLKRLSFKFADFSGLLNFEWPAILVLWRDCEKACKL